jgi:hypothetical protein
VKTQSKEKIEKAARLHALIQARLQFEKEEAELKDFFKEDIKDGVLEAGEITIIVETKNRTTLDRKKLLVELGDLEKFESQTQFKQVTVKSREVA